MTFGKPDGESSCWAMNRGWSDRDRQTRWPERGPASAKPHVSRQECIAPLRCGFVSAGGKSVGTPESRDAVRLEEVKGWGGGGGSSSAAFGNQGASPWVACESPPSPCLAAAKPNPSTLSWAVSFFKKRCLNNKHTNEQSVYMWSFSDSTEKDDFREMLWKR